MPFDDRLTITRSAAFESFGSEMLSFRANRERPLAENQMRVDTAISEAEAAAGRVSSKIAVPQES